MRHYSFAPFLLLATSLWAQRPFRIEVEAPPANTYAAALSLLTDWGFPIQLAEEDNGVIITNALTIEQGRKLLHQRSGYWLDCGKDLFFSLAATADFVNYQFIILVAGDSSVSSVKVKLFANAIKEDNPLLPTECQSRKRLEPLFFNSLRARLTAAP